LLRAQLAQNKFCYSDSCRLIQQGKTMDIAKLRKETPLSWGLPTGGEPLTPSQPPITRTTHTLPFDKLSPRDFERLCLWLVEREGIDIVGKREIPEQIRSGRLVGQSVAATRVGRNRGQNWQGEGSLDSDKREQSRLRYQFQSGSYNASLSARASPPTSTRLVRLSSLSADTSQVG